MVNKQQENTVEILKTKRLEIVDAQGQTRAALAADSEDGSAGLSFFSKEGIFRSDLRVNHEGDPELRMCCGERRMRLLITVNNGGVPVFSLAGDKGNIMFTLCNDPQTGPLIQFQEADGAASCQIGFSSDSGPMFRMMDSKGVFRMGIRITQEGNSELILRDGEGHSTFKIQAAETPPADIGTE
jgi:hypothetical protein